MESPVKKALRRSWSSTTVRWGVIGVIIVAIAAGAWLAWPRPVPPDLSLQRVQKAGVLVVGIDPSYPPFESLNGKGQIVGFDVDVANDFAHRLGVRVQFVSIDFGSIFDALEVSKFDAIIGGVSPAPEYQKRIAFSIPYFDDGLVVVENPGISPRVLGIESGSDADLDLDQLRPKLPNYTFQQFDDQDEIHTELSQKKLHGAIVDATTAEIWAHQTAGLVVRPTRLTSYPFVVAVRRPDQKLLLAINQQLTVLKESGVIDQLEQKWFTG